MSLHKWPLFGKPKWIGLDNYVWMINDERFWQCLKFTLVYTITVTPMLFIVAIGTALLCNVKTWGTTFFRSIYFLPVVMSFATASFVWLWLYSEWYGVIIFLLKAIDDKILILAAASDPFKSDIGLASAKPNAFALLRTSEKLLPVFSIVDKI